ncbi:MAG: polyprenyl synthetase family protein [Rhodobacteraceae bacterium]|nr:polyprenyl synthetase family protein [Paracoccaceae bacterium]
MFLSVLSDTQDSVKTIFEECISSFDKKLFAPMLHAFSGGKCLRAFLAVESAKIYNLSINEVLRVATAAEVIHAYSLIHDDLPCMDDDDLRRGKPTVHVRWDEATAVLTGDALQTLAFEILSDAKTSKDPQVRLDLISTLTKAIGANGMILGQVLDMDAEKMTTVYDLDSISNLQGKKTGALIEWSAQVGPVMAKKDNNSLRQYARLLGLAFQVQDDILDVEGGVGKVGKKLRKDKVSGKATFVTLLGLEGAKEQAKQLIDQAINELEALPVSSDNLKAAAQFVISREL